MQQSAMILEIYQNGLHKWCSWQQIARIKKGQVSAPPKHKLPNSLLLDLSFPNP